MIKKIIWNDMILAIVIPSGYRAEGIHFCTPDSFSQQIGYMNRPEGYIIPPHEHNHILRTIVWTQEVLLIRSGKVRLDIYEPGTHKYIESHVLSSGDAVLLAQGGHGLKMLEPSEILEVKQGPYAGDEDKTRYNTVSEDIVCIKE